MFESFSGMFGGDNDRKKGDVPPRMLPEDKLINQEINEWVDKKTNEEYNALFDGVKFEKDILSSMISYIKEYIELHSEDYGVRMPLGEFLERIEEDKNFEAQHMANIDYWIDQKEGKINLEKSVQDFLIYAEKILKEDDFLLNPDPEK
jgi:hypothetical protein